MIIIFQKILFPQEFLICFGCFRCTFSAYISHNVSYLIDYQLTKTQFQTFFTSQDIKQYVFKFFFSQLMTRLTLRFIFDYFLEQWLSRRKRGEEVNTKIWILWKRKKVFSWDEKLFSKIFKNFSEKGKISFLSFWDFIYTDSWVETVKSPFAFIHSISTCSSWDKATSRILKFS